MLYRLPLVLLVCVVTGSLVMSISAAAQDDQVQPPGPDLLDPVMSADGWQISNGAQGKYRRDRDGRGNDGGNEGGAEGGFLELRLPEQPPEGAPESDYVYGLLAPAAQLTLKQPLDVSGWDIMVMEIEQTGDDDVALGLHLRDAEGVSNFQFPALFRGKGEVTRLFLDLKWLGDTWDATTLTSVMFSKYFSENDERFKVLRLRPADHAITRVWDVQDRVDALEDPSSEEQDMRERAKRMEAAYWSGPTDGPPLGPAIEALEAELNASVTARVQAAAKAHAEEVGEQDYVTVVASSMERLPLVQSHHQAVKGRPWSGYGFAEQAVLEAAGNEHESVQVALLPLGEPLRGVTWEVSPLRHESGATVPTRARLVGYVRTMPITRYTVSPPNPMWRADVVLDFIDKVDEVPGDELLPIWVTADVPVDAPAGEYVGELMIRAQGIEARRVPIRLEVWPFSLPEKPALRTALRINGGWLGKVYGQSKMSQVLPAFEDLMLKEYGMDPGIIYRGKPPPWSEERLRELVEAGLPGINLTYINSGPEKLPPLFPAIDEYLKVIDKVEGARELVYFYGFDEWGKRGWPQLYRTVEALKERYPDIPVMSTMRSTSFGTEFEKGQDPIDIHVPRINTYAENAHKVPAARENGSDVWYYTCVHPDHPYPNLYIEYPLIESRILLGSLAAKYRPGGFLYYSNNRWMGNDKPITTGPRTDWDPHSFRGTNGDGSFTYAGPEGAIGSLRLENMRDGMEDLAYYQMLRERLGGSKDASPAEAEVPAEVLESGRGILAGPGGACRRAAARCGADRRGGSAAAVSEL